MDLLAQGNHLFVEESYTEAAKAYTNAIRKLMGIEQFGALFGRAKCRIENGDISLAIADLTQCISLNPKHQLSNYYLGYYLMKQNSSNYDVLQKCKHYLNTANELNKSKNEQSRFANALKRVTTKLEKLTPPATDTTTTTTTSDNNTNTNDKSQTKDASNSEEKEASNNTSEKLNTSNNDTTANAADTTTAATDNNAPKVKTFRDTWYQSPTTVTYTLYIKNLTKNDVKVDFGDNSMSFDLTLPDGNNHTRTVTLFGKIVPDKCKFTVNKYKVNCVLTKETAGEWKDLEAEVANKKQNSGIGAPWNTNKNWDKVNDFAKDELEKDKPEGDEALQSLFQKIYKDADEDQRRAMVKSFQTSNGTVLSTNWGDVKDKDYEGKDKVLPTGQDVKKWEY